MEGMSRPARTAGWAATGWPGPCCGSRPPAPRRARWAQTARARPWPRSRGPAASAQRQEREVTSAMTAVRLWPVRNCSNTHADMATQAHRFPIPLLPPRYDTGLLSMAAISSHPGSRCQGPLCKGAALTQHRAAAQGWSQWQVHGASAGAWMWSATVASVPMPWRSMAAMRSRSLSFGGGCVTPCAPPNTHAHRAHGPAIPTGRKRGAQLQP